MLNMRTVSSRDAAKFGAMRVLLVDDHPQIRSIISGILNGLGIANVTTAERGDIALKRLSNDPYDLLITDYEMQGMSGVELASAVRTQARSAAPSIDFKIPILMITSNVTHTRLTEARDGGIDEILAKPFTVIAVAERLTSLIHNRRDFVISGSYIGPCRRRAKADDYAGVKRRDSDLTHLPEIEVVQEQSLVRQEAQTLCLLAQSCDVLGLTAQDTTIATALSAAQRAKRIREPLLERACMSLVKYVQWAATRGAVEAKIVETHGQAIIELLELGTRDLHLSQQVTQGLEYAVQRRMARRSA